MKNLMLCGLLFFSPMVFANSPATSMDDSPRYSILLNHESSDHATLEPYHFHDSLPFATVVIYRPDNQLLRKYKIHLAEHESFHLKRYQVKTLKMSTNQFAIKVGAWGHQGKRQDFELENQKVHYFRLQDRNNYGWLLATLEAVEVTESTYRKDLQLAPQGSREGLD
jgi:hypothetical protein